MKARGSTPVRFLRELTLPRDERRAAAIDAERHRHDGYKYHGP
jgi:hypothetical protein